MRCVTIALAAALAACSCTQGGPTDSVTVGESTQALTTSYSADSSLFANPERGFHTIYDIQTDRSFPRNASSGATLVHSYIHLDGYRNQNIPQSELDKISAGFAAVRGAGLKVIPRFAYNFGPWPNCNPDSSEAWIKTHIGQVAAVLNANRDVIAWIEAGFIGCWGEWHTSTNHLDGDAGAKQRIVAEMFARWPDRPIQIRYPVDLRNLRATSSFSAAQKERLGMHHDCMLAEDPFDFGTWARNNSATVQQDKDFVAGTSTTAPNGGETCSVSSRSHCSTALSELSAQHWTNLNQDYNVDVLNIFKQEGCYDAIKSKLGYRFVLQSATYASSAAPGSVYSLSFSIKNDGWGRLYNQRPLFAVLYNGSSTYTFDLSENARGWGPGETKSITKSFTLPSSMAIGTYNLALWMPDGADSLRGDNRYAVRFANTNMWQSGTRGYNLLATGINVGGGSSTPASSCTDGVKNGNESGIDCGGSCSACAAGSTNLLGNPSFETGSLGPWASWGGMSVSSGAAQDGTWKASIACKTGGEQTVPVSPSSSYTLSGYGQVSGTNEWGALGYQVLDNANLSLVGDNYSAAFGASWAQRSVTFTTPSNAAKVKVMTWHECGSRDMYLDNVKLVRNSIP